VIRLVASSAFFEIAADAPTGSPRAFGRRPPASELEGARR